MGKRIVFTGGSGKAGRHVVPHLLSHGYEVLNVDLRPLEHPGVHTLIADVTDGGQVFNALTSHLNMAGFETRGGRRPPDAVVHFAAIPRNMIQPDAETFRANVMGTYHVIEAATKLGIRKIVIASSETTYGVCFADGDKDYACFPLRGGLRRRPDGQLRAVEGGQREHGARVRAPNGRGHLRAADRQRDRAARVRPLPGFPGRPEVAQAQRLELHRRARPGPDRAARIEKDGLGFQVFNAVNDNITADLPTAEFLARHRPGVPIRRPLDELEAPISNRKIREVLGFREEHDWRKYVNPEEPG